MYKRNKRNYEHIFSLILIMITIMLAVQVYFSTDAHAEEADTIEEKIVEQQSNSSRIRSIESQLQKYSEQDANKIFEGYDPESILNDMAKGKFEFNIKSLVEQALLYLFNEIHQNIHVLIKLVILVVLCALLKNLQASFLSEGVGELAFFVCYIVLVSIMLVSFSSALNMGKNIIDSMVNFMYATVPILITLLVSGGSITSGSVFQPVLIMIVEFVATVIKNVFIPLIFLSTILSIVNNISNKIQISKLAGFIKQITGWALGLILTVFIGVVSIQGTLGAVVDGVASKTAKFAIGAFIPVVGKCLSDAADTVLACTLLVRNAGGVAVMIGIIVICTVPLLKILALIILYRITGVLIEPIAEKRLTDCVNDIADSLTYILGIVASVAFMFLISVTAIVCAGNLSAMVR